MHRRVGMRRTERKKEKPPGSLSLVEPEGPRRLQRIAGVLILLDRAHRLVRQHRRFQQVRRGALLRFAFRRGHVRNDGAAALQRHKNHVMIAAAAAVDDCDENR